MRLAGTCRDVPVPATWTETVALARRKLAVIPAFNAADLFLHFFDAVKSTRRGPVRRCRACRSRATSHAHRPRFAPRTYRANAAPIFDWNPIQVAERMIPPMILRGTRICHYTWHNNYARDGFARTRLRFGNLISSGAKGSAAAQCAWRNGHPALSNHCRNAGNRARLRMFRRQRHDRKGRFT